MLMRNEFWKSHSTKNEDGAATDSALVRFRRAG
jgi:hypothetical protein